MANPNKDFDGIDIILPRGVAIYPKLNKPDFKFEKAGSYEAKVRLDPADDTADGVMEKKNVTLAQIIERLEGVRDAFLEEKKAELAASKDPKAKKKSKEISVRAIGEPDLDDEGDETGLLVIKGKMKASGISRKDGKPWKREPKLFDAKGKPFKASTGPSIYGGSVLKLAVKARPYYMAAENEVGVAFYLEAAQVIELVSGGGGRSASAYGFGTEDGFAAEDARQEVDDSEAGDDTPVANDEF